MSLSEIRLSDSNAVLGRSAAAMREDLKRSLGHRAGLHRATPIAISWPVVAEKAGSCRDSGCGISLYPFGSAVLHGIGVYPGFAAASAELKTYEIAGRHGGVIRPVDFARLMAGYSPTYLTARGTLIRLLREAGGHRVDLHMATTVGALREAGSQVEASLSAGSTEAVRPRRFDLVTGCGGIHSVTRELLFGLQPGVDTGWTVPGIWVAYSVFCARSANADSAPAIAVGSRPPVVRPQA
jgi:2-polyprenyl-6-methoxyphenol hydroxylase-like FAD-dependent oxidoreductase